MLSAVPPFPSHAREAKSTERKDRSQSRMQCARHASREGKLASHCKIWLFSYFARQFVQMSAKTFINCHKNLKQLKVAENTWGFAVNSCLTGALEWSDCMYRLSLEGWYHKYHEWVWWMRDVYYIVLKVIKLMLPRPDYDNLFIIYLCQLSWSKFIRILIIALIQQLLKQQNKKRYHWQEIISVTYGFDVTLFLPWYFDKGTSMCKPWTSKKSKIGFVWQNFRFAGHFVRQKIFIAT